VNLMPSKKILLPFVLALMIAVSGCIGQQQKVVVGQNGLAITDFYTEPSENNIESGEEMNIYLVAENVGGTTAKNVVAELLGVDWVSNRLYARQNPVDALGNPVGFTLIPPNPQYGTPGQTQQFSWLKLPTPYVSEGLHKTYNLKARLTYEYATSAATDSTALTAYSKSWYDTLLQQGKIGSVSSNMPVPVIHSIDPTPITVSMTGPDKIIVPEARPYSWYQVYTYKITISNVGGGVPITNGEDGLIYAKIWLNGPGYFQDCLGLGPEFFKSNYWQQPAGVSTLNNMLTPALPIYQQYNNYQYTQDEFRSIYTQYPFYIDSSSIPYLTIKLRRGESVTKSCTIAVQNPDPWGNYWGPEGGISPSGKLYRSQGSFSMFFELNYKYYLDADTSVTVSGWQPQSYLPSGSGQSGTGQQQGSVTTQGCTSDAECIAKYSNNQAYCNSDKKCVIPNSGGTQNPTGGTQTPTTTCTAGWKCKDASTRGYQNADCTWMSTEVCQYGCTNGVCNSAPAGDGGTSSGGTVIQGQYGLYLPGELRPFGCWYPSVVDSKKTYYEQQTHCTIKKDVCIFPLSTSAPSTDLCGTGTLV